MTCLFTRAGFRKRGISRALAAPPWTSPASAAPAPSRPTPSTTKNVILEELHVGTECAFADAGFTEVSRPTLRRVVMRIDF